MSISSQIITLYAHDYIKIDANFDSILCSTKIFRPVYYVSSTADVHNSLKILVSSSIILRDFICWLKIQKLFEQNVASGHIFFTSDWGLKMYLHFTYHVWENKRPLFIKPPLLRNSNRPPLFFGQKSPFWGFFGQKLQ